MLYEGRITFFEPCVTATLQSEVDTHAFTIHTTLTISFLLSSCTIESVPVLYTRSCPLKQKILFLNVPNKLIGCWIKLRNFQLSVLCSYSESSSVCVIFAGYIYNSRIS